MDSEEIKANEKRLFECFNRRDFEAVDSWINEHVAENFVNYTPHTGEERGREGLKMMFKNFAKSFPDMQIHIEDLVLENNTLCFRPIVSGAGKDTPVLGIAMVKFKNGKMVERWAYLEQEA